MLRKLGLYDRWIALMMMYVCSISFSVLINGELKGKIIHSRGLRQRDHISPYLFLLCVKGLSTMLKKEEENGNIKGVAVRRGAPRISHLVFADDSIIFYRATVEEGSRVNKVLEDYERESGQKLNKDKTSLFFSRNTSREIQDQVKNMFSAQIIQLHERYLGLPPILGKGKRQAYGRIEDQVGRKIDEWKGKLLSGVGREVLIKSVAQATPIYTMSCFRLLDLLCKDLS